MRDILNQADNPLIEENEPFRALLTQGMVLAPTYYREAEQRRTWYNAKAVDSNTSTLIADGKPVHAGGIQKMSKSKNNGVDPQEMVETYGADAVRLYMLFTSPPEKTLEWSDAAIEGSVRYLHKLWQLALNMVDAPTHVDTATLTGDAKKLWQTTNQTIAKVTDDLHRRYTFNTAIAAIMKLTNEVLPLQQSQPALARHVVETIILLLTPMVPHICHELWQRLGYSNLENTPYPQADPSALIADTVTIVVQINGKRRTSIDVDYDTDQHTIEQLVLQQEKIQHSLGGKTPKRIIHVANKLVNIVV